MDFNLWHSLFVLLSVYIGETFGCMFGGGSFFIQPALMLMGVSAKMAVANDIAAAAFASLGFLWKSRQNIETVRPAIAMMAPSLVAGALTGGFLLQSLPVSVAEFLVVGISTFGFLYVLRRIGKDKKGGHPEGEPIAFWQGALVAAGLFLGFYDGISGAGGGIIAIAVLSFIMRDSMKNTLLLANGVSAISLSMAGVTFLCLGLLDFELLIFMVPAAFLAGISAAWISAFAPERLLRAFYAVVLGGLLLFLTTSILQKYGVLPEALFLPEFPSLLRN